ncbi:MAG: hypothetical protein J6S06_01925 [Alphaproteobacteria bacterium]|nr:hypothetical protein [Alphaproteobacteria bacterium]
MSIKIKEPPIGGSFFVGLEGLETLFPPVCATTSGTVNSIVSGTKTNSTSGCLAECHTAMVGFSTSNWPPSVDLSSLGCQ